MRAPRPAPYALSSFIGRRQELADIKELLRARRLVTITGAAGVGKTRFALEAVRADDAENGSGAWIVDLAQVRKGEQVPAVTARALGLGNSGGSTTIEAIQRGLADDDALVVIDNCEHLRATCAELSRALIEAGPGIRCLATSREPLGLEGEVLFPLSPLELPAQDDNTLSAESVQLFMDRARAGVPGFRVGGDDLEAVATICRRLDGLPLAIELAAARVRVLAPGELAARLDDRFRLLTDTGGSRPTRHHTLHAAIGWSFDLLTEPERLLLQRLAVFPASWSLQAAEAICAYPPLGPADILDLVSSLVDRSFVVVERGTETRYRLLETIREFARQGAGWKADEERLRDRHAEWAISFAERWGARMAQQDDLDAGRRISAESAGIDAALEWLSGRPGGGAGIARVVGALAGFWFLVSWLRSYERWILRAVDEQLEGSLRVRALLAGGLYFHHQRDDVDTAERLLLEAVEVARAIGDPGNEAQAHSRLGVMYWHRARPQDALRTFNAGLELAEFLDPAYISGLHAWMNVAASAGGDAEEARRHVEQALAVAREHNLVAAECVALNHAGELDRELGRWDAAAAAGHRLLELQDGTQMITGRVLGAGRVVAAGNYANVLCRLGRWREAAYWAADAIENLDVQGSTHHAECALLGCAGALMGLGQGRYAVRLLAAGDAACHEWWEPSDEPDFSWYRAELQSSVGVLEFEREWEAGRRLTLPDALNEARDVLADLRRVPSGKGECAGEEFTRRESEVLQRLVGGLSNREIADELVLSVRTVESHVANICGKLGVHTRAQAVAEALTRGIAALPTTSTEQSPSGLSG